MRRARCSLIISCLLAASPAYADGVTLPEAERIVLDNGTVLILNENHEVPLIGLQAVVRGGAAADVAGKYGVANLLAGLLEKGAGDRSAAEFAEAIASVGGDLGAAANLESVTVSADFMAPDSKLMVGLVADMLQRPALDKTEFEKLRDRSINLIKAAKGSDPSALIPAYANAFLFGEHPYGNPVTGSESSLANVSHRDLLAYHTDMMGGDRLIVSVSGDFDSASMRTDLIAAFAGWRAASGDLPSVEAATRSATSRVYLIDKPGAKQTYFYIGNVAVARDFNGRAELDLANTVFGGRFTSMLMTELRTKSGLSYSARSQLTRHSRSGSVFISSFTETSKTVAALDVALGVLGQLRDSGLDETTITSARNYVMGQFPPRLETAVQIAGMFASLELFGLDASYIDDYGQQLDAATPDAIAKVIDEVYPPADALIFVILGDAGIIRDQIEEYGPLTEISITEPHFHPRVD